MKKLITLLRESIFEADDEKKATPDVNTAADKLQQAISGTSIEDFVSKFKNLATDPKVQAVLKAGRDDGAPEDEVISYTEGSIPVKSLSPTQSEIGFNDSIQNILTDKFGSLKSILEGNAKVGKIVTYNGKYVIDGHHRWSQVYAANPEASVDALDIKGNLKWEDILKIVHTAIAAELGKSPTEPFNGINILDGISLDQVKERVDALLTDEKVKKIWADNGQKDNQAVAEHIYKNLKGVVEKSNNTKSSAPPRDFMPQTNADNSDPKAKLDLLAKGIVNFKDPKGSDVKKEALAEVKRMQKLAGIRK